MAEFTSATVALTYTRGMSAPKRVRDASHLNPKFGSLFFGRRGDGGEDFIGGFQTFVGLGVFVVRLDEGDDIGFEFCR